MTMTTTSALLIEKSTMAIPAARRRIQRKATIFASLAIGASIFIIYNSIRNHTNDVVDIHGWSLHYDPMDRPEDCTSDEIVVLRHQLPPTDCVRNRHKGYTQKCSFSYATRCPDNPWLEDYFHSIHRNRMKLVPSSSSSNNNNDLDFLGIFIGCNKGMDAVNAMRMGSGNSIFDKEAWRKAMSKSEKLSLDVCGQSLTKQFSLDNNMSASSSSSSYSHHRAEVHCVEPMPETYRKLNRSAIELGWDARGFVVTHAAIGKEDSNTSFPADTTAGVENIGLANRCGSGKCEDVIVYSLDTYMSLHVEGNNSPIHYLSIDVEGYDYDVIIGGLTDTIGRVNYLEFEYNWMGSWAKQSLLDAIELLDQKGFTCYWPGTAGRIWRITGCWMGHYNIHMWSNVACINRNSQGMVSVGRDMERRFRNTLRLGKELQINSTSA